MAHITLLAGTKKGLFWFESTDRQRWTIRGPFQHGHEINHAIYDPRQATIYATANNPWFGAHVVWSRDGGQTWASSESGPSFAPDSGLQLERLWHLEPGPPSDPGRLYLGVAPAALFRSDDGGRSWHEMVGLTQHPTRALWQPGAGGLCLHSMLADPVNPQRLFVGISAAGVFRSDDGGDSWVACNRGVRAEFLPNKYPEVGQCVHKLQMAPGRPNLLYQQNHCGVYRSDTAGDDWTEITAGLPSDFGFALAVHPREPETLYVVPLQEADFRCPPGGQMRVYRSREGGRSWEALSAGLPQEYAFVGMYREGMATDSLDPAGVYVGTNTGKIFTSNDEGDSWDVLADHLPPVYSVSVSVRQ
jgi:photosystem II stability/assembly factor-like uncharacterized protein